MGESIKIAGWSPYRRAGGVTGHVLAISEMAADYFGKRVDLRADHFGSRPVEGYISEFSRTVCFSHNEDFYSGPDYPNYCGCLMRYESVYMGKTEGVAGRYAGTGNLRLLRPVRFYEDSAFAGGNGEVCFVDSSGRNSPYSFRMLNEADLILVFLPDNSIEIRRFFHLYSSFLSKSFFIINNYSPDNSFVFDILTEHRVPRQRIATMPYCPELARACIERNVDAMIRCQISRRRKNRYFKCVKEITKRVLAEAQRQTREGKSCEGR